MWLLCRIKQRVERKKRKIDGHKTRTILFCLYGTNSFLLLLFFCLICKHFLCGICLWFKWLHQKKVPTGSFHATPRYRLALASPLQLSTQFFQNAFFPVCLSSIMLGCLAIVVISEIRFQLQSKNKVRKKTQKIETETEEKPNKWCEH